MNKRARPTGTPFAAALAQPPVEPILKLSMDVPCPGPRFGVSAKIRTTLMAMHGDASFIVKDPNMVYNEAKKLGIRVRTRKEGTHARVWRIS